MGATVDTDDLLSAAQVAEILGLAQYNSVTTYLNRYEDFPQPALERSGGRLRLWLRQDIEQWRSEHLAGRRAHRREERA